MNIKASDNPSFWSTNPVFNFLRSLGTKTIVLILLFVVTVGATSLASVYYGMYLYKVKKADSYDEFFENAVQTKLSIIPNYIKGFLAPNPERLTIDIKHKHFQKLAYKRELALQNGILLTSSDDFVPGKIRYGDRVIRVKLRLKGDWTDHLLGEKWSFRVKVRGDNTLFGMKQFSLHHPRTRNFVYEWIFLKALKSEGLISLRYKFVDVTVNGKDLGVYALEEHFEKRLVEHNEYREGPILKFNENYLWADRAAHQRFGDLSPTGLQQESASSLDAFKTNTVLRNPVLYGYFLTAHTLLENFRNQKLPTHKVFDVKKLAKFFALTDLFGAEHSVMWQNLRFYYNPVTSLLEPVGFDANAGRNTIHVVGSNRALNGSVVNKFKDIVFSDEVFFEEYISELERLSSGRYLETFLADIQEDVQENLAIIYKEFPYFHYSERVFYRNRESIRDALNPVKALHAYYGDARRDHLELELGNIQAMPIEVLDVVHPSVGKLEPTQRTILQPKLPHGSIDYRTVTFNIPNYFVWADSMRGELKLNYKILGTNVVREEPVYAWPRTIDDFDKNDFIRRPPNFKEFDFLTVVDSSKKVFVQPGNWKIRKSVIIPQGYSVICREGTQLDLLNSAVILSYSPLDFQGNEEAPIVIQSADSTGQGIVVMNATTESNLNYVIFRGLSNPDKSGWQLTGAVTFYESPVHISHCQFSSNRSEDALNIIRADFTIHQSLFEHTFSDAFDGDFTSGKITNSSFVACGNDGVDVSGSNIEIENLFIKNAGDKGLSAGENSQMTATNVEIIDSEIAVASKDISEINVNKLKLANCEVGFTIYQKKPEFGSAQVNVKELKKSNIKVPYLVEERSKLMIDGAVIAATHKNVSDILYGVEYGKSSK